MSGLVVYLALGMFFTSILAYSSPRKFRTLQGDFRADFTVCLIIVWFVPAFVVLVRVLVWPIKQLVRMRVKRLEDD